MPKYSKLILVTLVLLSVGLFQLKGLNSLKTAYDLAALALVFLHLLVFGLYGGVKSDTKASFSFLVIILLVSVLISSLSASFFHNQQIYLTLWEQRRLYLILLYFVLFYLRPDPEWLIRLILFMAITTSILHLAQYFLYPLRITEAKIFEQRGSIRINMPGTIFRHLGFFLAIDLFFQTRKKYFAAAVLLMFIVAILSAYRSTVAFYLLISLGYILLSRKVQNKFVIVGFALVMVVIGFFAFNSIIAEMQVSAQKEVVEGTENLRFRAAEFFISEKNANSLTYFIGNGQPHGDSAYGQMFQYFSLRFGFYLSDIGFAGYYYRFGLFAVLSVLIIFLRLILGKYDTKYDFIRLFMLYQLLVSFNTVLPFDSLDGTFVIVVLMYIADFSHSSLKKELG